jgi:hypothetical protein
MIYSLPDALSDTLAVTGRNLIALRRVPQLLCSRPSSRSYSCCCFATCSEARSAYREATTSTT